MAKIFVRSAAFAFALVLAGPSAEAQSYRCSSGANAYLSDRPCGTGTTGKLGSYGPSRATAGAPNTSQFPGAPKVQEHVKYLGSGCASISEAIRTGPARGVRSDVISALHEEYNQKCSIEDQAARTTLSQEQTHQRSDQLAQRQAVANVRQQASLKSERCVGMQDLIALKRKRESQLNPTEVEALREIEKTYNVQCLGRQ